MKNDVVLPIFNGHHASRHTAIQNAQLQNFYITDGALAPTAGYEVTAAQFPGTVIRGEFLSRLLNQLVIVVDQDVYLSNGVSSSLIGLNVIPGTGNVKIIENFNNQLAFLSDGIVFIYNMTTKIFEANTTIGALVEDITYQDTYFFFALAGKEETKLSEQNNGLLVIQDFTALANGINVGIASLGQQIWIFTNTDVNIFYNTGGFPKLYAKDDVLAPNYGCISKDSIAVDYGYICWFGTTDTSSPFIAISKGGEPEVLSDEDIDFSLDEVTDPKSAIGLLYQMDGHIFYHVYFPTDNFGFIYDFYTKRFSRITYETYIKSVAKFNNKYYATVEGDNNLYLFDVSITEENGKIVNRYVSTPTYTQKGPRFGIKKISCYLETGFSEGGNCELLLSKDKGVTFNPMQVKVLPPPGKFGYFLNFNQLGSAYWVNVMLRFNVKGKFALKEAIMQL